MYVIDTAAVWLLMASVATALFCCGCCRTDDSDAAHSPKGTQSKPEEVAGVPEGPARTQAGNASTRTGTVPEEFLSPEFMRTLDTQIIGDHRRIFEDLPPEAIASEEARKLVVWLLSRKDVRELQEDPWPDPHLPSIRIRLMKPGDNGQEEGYFLVIADPNVGSPVELLVGNLQAKQFDRVRLFEADEEFVKRVEKLYDAVQTTKK